MFDRRTETEEHVREEGQTPSQHTQNISHTIKLIQGENLFTVGTRRTCAYRVLKGGFCHYVKWPDGQHHVIEFVYTGEVIGFGHYQSHLTTAKALLESEVIELTESEFSAAREKDPSLDARLCSMADREFEIIRQRSIGSKPRPPLIRLASYISAMAHLGCRSGESCVPIPQKEGLKVLANMLEIGSTEIKNAFLDLKKRGLISKKSNCIVVRDQLALDQFVDGLL